MNLSFYQLGDNETVQGVIGECLTFFSDSAQVNFLYDSVDGCQNLRDLDARLGTEMMFNEAQGGSSGASWDNDAFGTWSPRDKSS